MVIHKGDKSWRHESGDSRDRSVKSTYFKRHSGMIHDGSQRHVYLLEIPYNWKFKVCGAYFILCVQFVSF